MCVGGGGGIAGREWKIDREQARGEREGGGEGAAQGGGHAGRVQPYPYPTLHLFGFVTTPADCIRCVACAVVAASKPAAERDMRCECGRHGAAPLTSPSPRPAGAQIQPLVATHDAAPAAAPCPPRRSVRGCRARCVWGLGWRKAQAPCVAAFEPPRRSIGHIANRSTIL